MAISVVQTKTGTTTGAASVTVTLTSPTTAGNCLIAVMYGGATSISGVTLGGSAGNWASQKSLTTALTGIVAIWADPNCAGSQTSVVVTQGSSNQLSVLVYEVSGLATSSILDASQSNGPTSLTTSAWTSNASGTTTQASELAVGVVGGFNGNAVTTTITGPSSPWTNETQLTAATGVFLLTGFNILSSTGTVTYNGTSNISGTQNAYIACVATFKAAASGTSVSLPVAQVAVAAQPPSLAAGPIALPRAQVAILAPPPTPGVVRALALPVALVAILAPVPALGLGHSVALPVALVAITARAPGITGAGRIVALTPAAVVVQAHAPGLGAASFPESPLGALVELDLNGTWTDVSSYVDYAKQEITLTRGHADESTTASPAAMDVALTNTDARFSDTNPAGPWYGQFGRNTPVRISLPAQTTYLRLEDDHSSAAACPDATALRITGDIDIRVDLDISGVTNSTIASKYNNVAGNTAWIFFLNTDGTLTFQWSDTGSDINAAQSTAPITMGRQCLRVTLDVNNGSGGNTATFYTGPVNGADGSTWTQLGSAVTTTGTTSIHAGTAKLTVGDWDPAAGQAATLNGSYFEFELRSGIGGTVVAHPVFSAQNPGATSFADAQGNTWSLSGTAELSGRDYRAHLEASAFTPSSDPAGISVWQQLNASGLLRRIQQGTKPIQSAFRRALPSAVALYGYWPCEDGNDQSGAGGSPGTPTQIASAIDGVPAGTFAANPSFASDSSFLCSYPIIGLNNTRLRFSLEPHATDTSNVLRFLLSVPAGGDSADGSILAELFTTGTVYRTDLIYWVNGSLELIGYNASGSQIFDSGIFGFAVNGAPCWISVELQQVGGNVQYSIVTLKPGFAAGNTTGTLSVAGTIGQGTSIMLGAQGNFASTAVGQVTYQGQWESLFDFASQLNAFQGEAAGDRFARLCTEEGLTSRIYGPPDETVAMGAQTPLALTTLLGECADADRGEIYEPRQILGLGYRTRASMQQQDVAVALDYSLDDLTASVESAEDDQYIVNDAVVTRAYTSSGGTGSSAEVTVTSGPLSVQEPPDGVNPYLTSATLNLNLDSQAQDLAGWLTNIGTADGPRFPGVTYDLARLGIGTLLFSLPAADMGDRLTLGNFPAWLPPDGADQLIAQTTETIGEFSYSIKWVLVPGRPYLTAIFDDAVFGHADTDGSTLSASVTSAATTLHVATTTSGSPLWTTTAADFPFDIVIDGERMTVTTITGSSSPQTFTVTRSVNGVTVAHAAGAGVDLFYPAIMSL